MTEKFCKSFVVKVHIISDNILDIIKCLLSINYIIPTYAQDEHFH